jgi:hypothetical protein
VQTEHVTQVEHRWIGFRGPRAVLNEIPANPFKFHECGQKGHFSSIGGTLSRA